MQGTVLHFNTSLHCVYDRPNDDIAMQACEPYDLHNTKISEMKEGVYEEYKTSSDADRVYDEATIPNMY